MADDEPKRGSNWSEAEKVSFDFHSHFEQKLTAIQYQLLLRIVYSQLPEGKGVDWTKIKMPGRTSRAMKGQWGKIVQSFGPLAKSPPPVDEVPKEKKRKATGITYH